MQEQLNHPYELGRTEKRIPTPENFGDEDL